VALVVIPEARQRLEAERAARAQEETERQERREARLAGGVMVGSILLQYLVAGLAMHMTGDEAQAFYLIAMLLGPLPLTVAVIAGSRKD
jgi:hypothetical protein